MKTLSENIFNDSLRHTGVFIRWILIGLVVIYGFSGIYSISSNQIGVLQHGGRVIAPKILPGIHYALPWPFDRLTKVPVKSIKRLLIDQFDDALTGDNNLINVQCIIHYTIGDPVNYLFQVKNPDHMLHNMAQNAILHCLGVLPIDTALTSGKQKMVWIIKTKLQNRLDDIKSGLLVSSIELHHIRPPEMVRQYFSDVVNAKIEQVELINEAETYRNEKLPLAKSQADSMMQKAHAYKTRVVLKAEGESQRFEALLEQVHKSGASARHKIYMETIMNIMAKVGRKHLVDHNQAGQALVKIKMLPGPR